LKEGNTKGKKERGGGRQRTQTYARDQNATPDEGKPNDAEEKKGEGGKGGWVGWGERAVVCSR